MRPPLRKPVTIEVALYLLAFSLALSLRLLNLGEFPLSEYEAGWAMQAYDFSAGNPVESGTQPAYVLFTGLLFSIFVDTQATARLFPVLAGSCLVFLPWLSKPFTGSSPWLRRGGLIFAFLVAIDPGLVVASRLAGGPMMAMAFSLLAAGFIIQGNPAWAGLLAGLALLSGPSLVQGMGGLGLAFLASWILNRREAPVFSGEESILEHLAERIFWRRFFLFAAGTIFFGGLLWLRFPQGLSGLANSFPAYLWGWMQPSGVPALRLPAALLLYQPLAVVIGAVAIFRAWWAAHSEGSPNRFLSLWVGAGLIMSMIYPARQVVDVIWVLAPLWFLAASELSQHELAPASSPLRLPGLGLAGAVSLFIFLIWYNLVRLGNLGAQPYLYAAIIGGLILMLLIVATLVSMGWGLTAARFGMVWGFSLIAGVYLLSSMWGASQVRGNDPVELWTIMPGYGQAGLLKQTLEDYSARKYGMEHEIRLQSSLSSPDVRWLLREFRYVTFSTTVGSDQQPDIILTSQPLDDPNLQSSYRGQELVMSRTALWNGIVPPNLLRWLTYRELPFAPEKVILWAHQDYFPGDLTTNSEGSLEPSETGPQE